MVDDIKRALLVDKEAAGRLTEAGVLLPCAHCRGSGVLDSDHSMGIFWILCTGCGMQTEAFVTEEEACLAWNTRAPILSESELKKLEESGEED